MLNEVQTAKTHIKGQIVSISSQSLEKDVFTKSPKSPISFGSTGRKQLENDTSIEEDTKLINNLQDALVALSKENKKLVKTLNTSS